MKTMLVTVDEDISIDDYIKKFNDANKLPKDLQLTHNAFMNLKIVPSQKYNNGDLIRMRYDPEEKVVERIKPGTVICLPVPLIKVNVSDPLNSKSYLRQRNDIKAYFTESMRRLMSSDGYVKAETLTIGSQRSPIDVQLQNLNLRVWIYSKVLDELIDISPLVLSCRTDKSFENGSFSINVAPVRDFRDLMVREGGMNLTEVINSFNLIDNNGNATESFLSSILQENDLVFIRFERLNMERDNAYAKGDINQFIKKSALANPNLGYFDLENVDYPFKVWDMIGLIDNISFNCSSQDTSISETISGRDFTKLLSEDGAYFYPWVYMQGSSLFYAGSPTEAKSGQFKRNYLTGEILDKYLTKGYRTIKDTLFFVIDNLSNIGVVKDDVFESYGERRRKAESINGITGKVKGVWQIVDIFVEDILNERRLTGDLGSVQGTMMDFFERACQKPFVEFWGDTWVDTFDIIVRQPPFTKKAIYSVIDAKGGYITVENKDLLSYNLSFDNTCFSQYQLNIDNYLSSNTGNWGAGLVPVVLFPVIAETFGNKRIVISDSYINVDCLKGSEKQTNYKGVTGAMINDLTYVIETTVYLPFTRRGSIVVNGDRRIKVGTFIRLAATDELYYVTGVRQTAILGDSLMRVTEVRVERGMKFDFIKGSDEAKKTKYSYFDLVDTDLIKKDLNEYMQPENKEKNKNFNLFSGQTTSINQAAWDYFMKRRYLNIRQEREK